MQGNNKRVAIVDGCRTPFLKSGTGFRDTMAWELGRYAVKGLVSPLIQPMIPHNRGEQSATFALTV